MNSTFKSIVCRLLLQMEFQGVPDNPWSKRKRCCPARISNKTSVLARGGVPEYPRWTAVNMWM